MSLLRRYSLRAARVYTLSGRPSGKLTTRFLAGRGLTTSTPAPADPTPEYSKAKQIQEQFSGDVLRALRTLGKIFAWMGYGTIVAGLVTATAFEAGHVWVEQQMKVRPDEDAKRWGWEPDDWTGGEHGGTSSKLGLVGRHSVRAAWFALNYGTPFLNALNMSSGPNGKPGVFTYTDQDLLSASLYLEDAISRMRNKEGQLQLPYEKVVLNLFERYASVQELLGSPAALVKAYRSYLLVYGSKLGNSMANAQIAIKLGNLAERLEDEHAAVQWWEQAIKLVISDTDRPAPPIASNAADTKLLEPKSSFISKLRRWSYQEHSESEAPSQGLEVLDEVPASPPAQRTIVSALLALSAFFSRRGYLEQAKYVEEKTLLLIDEMVSRSQAGETPGQILHNMYLMHRKAVLTVHHAEVMYAFETASKKPEMEKALTDLLTAASLSELVSQVLTGKFSALTGENSNLVPKRVTAASHQVARPAAAGAKLRNTFMNSTALRSPAQKVLRDARLTATEAWDLAGIIYQKSGEKEKAGACFERALGWAGQPGEDEGISLANWESLWHRFVKAKEQAEQTSKKEI